MDPAALMRSLLFVPADQERLYAKAAELAADGYVVDLEDSVAEARKPAGRALVATHAARLAAAGSVWIRVNGHASPHFEEDIAAAASLDCVAGLVLPKIDGPDDLRAVEPSIARAEAAHGRAAGSLRLIVIIESAKAAWLSYDIAVSSGRVETLCFGGARDGDLMASIGCDWSNDGSALNHARQRVLLAARAAGCTSPLDGAFVDVSDGAGFERDTMLSRGLGYRGRTLIHPSQIEAANRIYAPAPDEVATSRRLLAAFSRAETEGRASVLFEGRMIDAAMARAARAVVGLSDMAGARERSED